MAFIDELKRTDNKKIIFLEVKYIDPSDYSVKSKWFSTDHLDIPDDLASGPLISCEPLLNSIPLFLREVDPIENNVVIKGTFSIDFQDPDGELINFFRTNLYANMPVNIYLTTTERLTFEYIQLAKAVIKKHSYDEKGKIKLNVDDLTIYEKNTRDYFTFYDFSRQPEADKKENKPLFFGEAVGTKLIKVNHDDKEWIDSGYICSVGYFSVGVNYQFYSLRFDPGGSLGSGIISEILKFHEPGEEVKLEFTNGQSVVTKTRTTQDFLQGVDIQTPPSSDIVLDKDFNLKPGRLQYPQTNVKVYFKNTSGKNKNHNEFYLGKNVDYTHLTFNITGFINQRKTTSILINKTDYDQFNEMMKLNEVITLQGIDQFGQIIHNDFKFKGAVPYNSTTTEIITDHKVGRKIERCFDLGENPVKLFIYKIKNIKIDQEERLHDCENYRNFTRLTFKYTNLHDPIWTNGATSLFQSIRNTTNNRTWFYFEYADETSTGPYDKIKLGKIMFQREGDVTADGGYAHDYATYFGKVIVPSDLGTTFTAYDDLLTQFRNIFEISGFSGMDFNFYFDGTDNRKLITGYENLVFEFMSTKYLNIEYARHIYQQNVSPTIILNHRWMHSVVFNTADTVNVTQTFDFSNGRTYTIGGNNQIILDKTFISTKNHQQKVDSDPADTESFGEIYIENRDLKFVRANNLRVNLVYAEDYLNFLNYNSYAHIARMQTDGTLFNFCSTEILTDVDSASPDYEKNLIFTTTSINDIATLGIQDNKANMYGNSKLVRDDWARFYRLVEIESAWIDYKDNQTNVGSMLKNLLDYFEVTGYVQDDLDTLDLRYNSKTSFLLLDESGLFYKNLNTILRDYNIYSYSDNKGQLRFKHVDWKNVNDLTPTIIDSNEVTIKLDTEDRSCSNLHITHSIRNFNETSTITDIADPLLTVTQGITGYLVDKDLETNLNQELVSFNETFFKYFQIMEKVQIEGDLDLFTLDLLEPISIFNSNLINESDVYIITSIETNGQNNVIEAVRFINL